MTKEEAWLMWMNESNRYVEYDWDTIKKSSHWVAFSRGWDAASINTNGWDDAYKMGMEAGKELAQREWQGLTDEDWHEIWEQFDWDYHDLEEEFQKELSAKHGEAHYYMDEDESWKRQKKLIQKLVEAKLKEKNT